MDIRRNGTQPAAKAAAENFTGSVWAQPLFALSGTPPIARFTLVTFTPGARTNWHTHPKGQTLFITAGSGRVQRWGGPVEVVHPGDVVWFPPGEKHWHGAAPDCLMSHIAVAESLDGKTADWMEPVTDEQYAAK